ncbi:hypothetical protein F2Q68_00013908 [Brassica cretica]|uniref:Uncharacterized protein n=1 Tax=Brassica cretica TaxID=69181 RepID=A0A8S9HFX2_BRACR|nr:hypothetical protein F2Q68_00013908 [Brassica cretica]
MTRGVATRVRLAFMWLSARAGTASRVAQPAWSSSSRHLDAGKLTRTGSPRVELA